MEDLEADEYVTQCFGFPLLAIERGLLETVDGVLNCVMDDMKEKLSMKYNKEKVEKSIEKLQTDYKESKKMFEGDFKQLVREHFSVSRNVLLPSDADQAIQYTEEEEEEIDRQLEAAKANLFQREALAVELKALSPPEGELERVVEALNTANELMSTACQIQDDVVASLGHLAQASRTIKPLLDTRRSQVDNVAKTESADDNK